MLHLGILLLLGVPSPSVAFNPTIVHDYYVTGHNLDTGERVIGYLTGESGSPSVGGVLYDRGDRWTVVGNFSGKGLFELRSICCRYSVEVTDEISGNKLLNRERAAQRGE